MEGSLRQIFAPIFAPSTAVGRHAGGVLIAVLFFAAANALGCERVGDWEDGECHDGELDRPRFCDRTGDLVADRPADAEQWLDPDTLIFAYTPVEDPAQYREVWDDFLDYLEEVTGRDVQFFAAQSNAAQIEAMRAGRLHIAGFSTGAVPLAVNCAGFVPMAMMADGDDYGYEMEIITHVDSGIESLDDLHSDHVVAFTSPTSNSGFKTPSVLLEREYGFRTDGSDFEVEYSGGHDNSLIGVHQRDYDIAAVANEVTDRIIERGQVDTDTDEAEFQFSLGAGCGPIPGDDDGGGGGVQIPGDEIRVLHRSETFPTTAFGPAYNLDPELTEAVEKAFFDFAWEGSSLQDEFSNASRFMPISYQEHWTMIRQVDGVFEDGYSCR